MQKSKKNRKLYLLTLMLTLSIKPSLADTNINQKQLHCLAKNIYHEAMDQETEGMTLVGHVVINRVKSKRFSETICEVVYEHKQFSWVHKKRNHRIDEESWELVLEIAKKVINRKHDPTNGALYFYNPARAKPGWAKTKKVLIKKGDHVFLK